MAGLGIGYYLRLDNWKTVTFGVGPYYLDFSSWM